MAGGRHLKGATSGDVEVVASRRSNSALALLAAVTLGAGLGVVMLWPRSADAIETPTGVTTTAPSLPVTTSSPSAGSRTPEPPPEPVVTAELPSPPTVAPSASPSASAQPSTSQTPAPRQAPTSTVRAPISVSPEPRPAFSESEARNGADDPADDRGLLPGLGGLL